MGRWSSQITANVNRAIAKGRRALGKGSRQTTYQNIFKTRREEMLEHSKMMRGIFRNANARSRVEVSTQARWYLTDNQKAINANHEHFQYFSVVLRERGLSQASSTLEEFIVFLMGNIEFTQMIGSGIETKKAVVVKPVIAEESEDEFCEWGGGAAAAPVDESAWGGGGADAFDDEEDEMV